MSTEPDGGTTPVPSARTQAVIAKVKAASDKAKREAERRAKARAESLALVERAKAGEAGAFRALVERNQDRLFAVAVGMLHDRDEAKDVVQDAFIKAHAKLDTFQAQAAFSTWIYRIAVNLCIDRKRAKARRRSVDLEHAPELSTETDAIYAGVDIAPSMSGSNPLANTQNAELGGKIGEALNALGEQHRSVIVLREIEGMSYEEIAQTLEIPKGTVMSRLFHARKKMQAALTPYVQTS